MGRPLNAAFWWAMRLPVEDFACESKSMNLYQGEDYDFLLRLTYRGFRIIELRYQLFDDLINSNEERALLIVYELADSGFVKYAFKTLKRFAAKEIGIAEPLAFIVVKTLAEAWEKDKASKARGGEADRHYLSLAVQRLARAKKSPETKNFTAQVNQQRFNRPHFEIDESVKERARAYEQRKV